MSGKASSRGVLRPAAAPRDGLARHLAGAGVAKIRLLRATPRVSEIDPHDGALCLLDLLAAIVADKSRYSCHPIPPSEKRFDCADLTGKIRELGGGLSLLNSPRTQQTQKGLFLEVET